MDPNGLVVLVEDALLRTTGLSDGLALSAISSQRENGEMVTGVRLMYCCCPLLPMAVESGCNGSSNWQRWYLKKYG